MTTTLRKLVTIVVLTAAIFVAAYGTSFFAMQVAFAETPAEHAGSGHADAHHHDNSQHFNFLGSPAEHYGKDIAGGPYGDGVNHNPATGVTIPGDESEMSAPFIFMVLNFILFLILMAWKAKPAFEKMAADRHDQIKTALDEAAKLRKQAADRLDEYQSKLAKADAEIKAMVEGLRTDAEADKQRILASAERQAAQMKRDAETRIAAEIELARASLTREVTVAATAAAEKLLREKMTATDQQQVINTFISGVQAAAQKEAR